MYMYKYICTCTCTNTYVRVCIMYNYNLCTCTNTYVHVQGTGSFPADMSALDVESDLEWDPPIKTISQSPFSLYDDGGVIYYKLVSSIVINDL